MIKEALALTGFVTAMMVCAGLMSWAIILLVHYVADKTNSIMYPILTMLGALIIIIFFLALILPQITTG